MSQAPKQDERFFYETLSEASNDLMKRGYTADFLLDPEKDSVTCSKTMLELHPEDFAIDEIYRFEGMTDPADEVILYAISSDVYHVKGMIINTFGASFSYRSSKLVEHLTMHH